MKRYLLALLAVLWTTPLFAQAPVLVTNIQAVDYLHDAALSLGTTSGPLLMCRTSAAEPTNASGDTRAFAVWCHGSGAIHVIDTDNNGNPATSVTPYYLTSAASTNSSLVKNAPGSLYYIHVTNTTSTTYYLRLYNLASAPTCSSATGFIESIPVFGTSVNGRTLKLGVTFGTGIGFCLTGGGSSTDNTNAAVGVYIALGWL
jgi:hypothetical protein